MKMVAAVMVLASLILADTVHATPSTQIWIPSPDVQAFLVGHIGVDNYFRRGGNGSGERDPNILDVGLTVGLLPFEKLQLEVGADYLAVAGDPNDRYPWSGNAKLGIREESLFPFSPAVAGGIYNTGKARKATDGNLSFVRSGQNIVYGLAAKTLPGPGFSLGRFSGGYYHGSKKALVPDNKGLLLSWDRTITELTEKLWVAVDYMGGENVNGALSFGAAWRFNRNVSLLLGYDKFRRSELSGEDTFTVQLDLDFP
ncbi:hypothetical protein [Geomonas anaerohicana]|uniref:Uncharacterized protein n=1 Tax=Geomonas anaerohicana TaxID=2798583 RepID=A0ABS0YCA9_9BACT|nr:hypothetical protein [Geomonas anaerohicana]MBJ6749933.1 hypothetical protein [Geomonas anaerohicana]